MYDIQFYVNLKYKFKLTILIDICSNSFYVCVSLKFIFLFYFKLVYFVSEIFEHTYLFPKIQFPIVHFKLKIFKIDLSYKSYSSNYQYDPRNIQNSAIRKQHLTNIT